MGRNFSWFSIFFHVAFSYCSIMCSLIALMTFPSLEEFNCSFNCVCSAWYYQEGNSCSICPTWYYCPGGAAKYECTNHKPDNATYYTQQTSSSCSRYCSSHAPNKIPLNAMWWWITSHYCSPNTNYGNHLDLNTSYWWTCDLYLNGYKVWNDLTDFYSRLTYGTKYEFRCHPNTNYKVGTNSNLDGTIYNSEIKASITFEYDSSAQCKNYCSGCEQAPSTNECRQCWTSIQGTTSNCRSYSCCW